MNIQHFHVTFIDCVEPIRMPVPMLTWGELCRLEPALLDLESDARLLRRDENQWPGWELVKRRLRSLIENTGRPELCSSEVYDLAYDTLAEAAGI